MRALGGKTPGQLTSSPAVDSQFRVECIMSEISPSSRVEQDELRSKCLRRDNWRCVVTRAVDMFTVLRCPDWPEAEEGINMAATECAHVLPLALAKFDSNRNLEVTIFVPSVLKLDLTRGEGLQPLPNMGGNISIFSWC